MDKGLIEIQGLESELKKITESLNRIEETIEIKKLRKNQVQEQIEYFERNLKFSESQKKAHICKEQNIEKWKFKTILKTILSFIVISSIVVFVNQLFTPATPSFIIFGLNSIMLLTGGRLAIKYGEANDYYTHKKYLKNNSLQDLEEEILTYKRELNKKYQNKNNVQSELTELNKEKKNILYGINWLNTKIESIKKIRTNVINEYIENNNELEELLNKEYETQKVLSK